MAGPWELVAWPWPALVLVALVAGGVRGFTGFGAGLVMAPAFSLLIGPTRAVPVLVLLELVASARLLPDALPRVGWRTILSLGLPAIACVPLGGALLTRLPPRTVRRLISGVVLVLVALLAVGWRLRSRPRMGTLAATGALSGLLSGVGGVGGPPVVLLLLGRPATPVVDRATLIVYFALTQAAASVTFAVHGLVDAAALWRTLVLAVPFWIGTHLGARWFDRSSEPAYRRLVLLLLGAVALAGII